MNNNKKNIWSLYQSVILFISIVTLLITASCNKESIVQPTTIDVCFRTINSLNEQPYLKFDEGYLVLSSMALDGSRQSGDDVYFRRDLKPSQKYFFSKRNDLPAFWFDIPEGIYSRVEMQFSSEYEELVKSQNDSILFCLKGLYSSINGSEFGVFVRVKNEQIFSIDTQPVEDMVNIVFESSTRYTALIKIEPQYWFQVIDREKFEVAANALSGQEESPIILIDNINNREIFDLIINRIDNSISIEFEN